MEPEYIVLINNKVNTNILSLRYTLTMCCIYNIVNFVFLAIRKNTGQPNYRCFVELKTLLPKKITCSK